MASEQTDAQEAAASWRGRQRDGRRLLLPPVHWPAVLVGVGAGLLAELLLTMFGIVSGVSVVGMRRLGLGLFGPWLWTGLAMLFGALVAGYLAARLCGWRRKVDGILHGTVAWAVTTIMFSVLATVIGGAIDTRGHAEYGPDTSENSQQQGTQPQAPQPTPAQALQRLLGAQGIALDPSAAGRLQQDIQAGRRDAAIEDLVRGSGLDAARAATLVDQATIALAAPPAQQAANPARNREAAAATAVAWGMLLAVALSLAIAMGGGALGVVGARHAAMRGRGTL